jgi:ribonuclease HI
MKNKVLIFADGASRGNPGRGGYGTVVVSGLEENFNSNSGVLHIKELGDRDDMTTNNKMELSAVISGLKYCEKIGLNNAAEFSVYTDSKYVMNGAKSWIYGWKKNGWKTTSKEEVKNKDLWEEMSDLIDGKKINWVLLPGHAGVVGNERCDQIATNLADKEKDELFDGSLSVYDHPKILDVFYNPDLIKVAKDDKKSKSSAKAYSYVSKVDGKINVDKSWSDCEKRVKGKKGALYKKSISLSDQENISKDFMSR